MPKLRHALIASIAATVLSAVGASAMAAEQPASHDLTCKSPVTPNETGHDLLKRFGKLVRVAVVSDIEGEQYPGLMLYPDDPKQQLEIDMTSDAVRGKVSEATVKDESLWTAYGLKLGMTLEEVTKANGGPLDLWGFQQFGDGGKYSVLGYFRPGKLEGGCKLLVVFTARPHSVAMPGPLYGLEHIASDNPELMKVGPLVTELSVTWESSEQ